MNNQACPAYTDHLVGKARGLRQQIKAMIRPVMLAGALIGGWGTEALPSPGTRARMAATPIPHANPAT
jgi:hypothetical protein